MIEERATSTCAWPVSQHYCAGQSPPSYFFPRLRHDSVQPLSSSTGCPVSAATMRYVRSRCAVSRFASHKRGFSLRVLPSLRLLALRTANSLAVFAAHTVATLQCRAEGEAHRGSQAIRPAGRLPRLATTRVLGCGRAWGGCSVHHAHVRCTGRAPCVLRVVLPAFRQCAVSRLSVCTSVRVALSALPPDFPMRPPVLQILQRVWHPNLDQNCVVHLPSIDRWNPASSNLGNTGAWLRASPQLSARPHTQLPSSRRQLPKGYRRCPGSP